MKVSKLKLNLPEMASKKEKLKCSNKGNLYRNMILKFLQKLVKT